MRCRLELIRVLWQQCLLPDGHTCEKPLAVGCGDLKGFRRQTSSETLYSFGSIDFRLMSSLCTAGVMMAGACAASTTMGFSAYLFVSIAAMFASLRCCSSVASTMAVRSSELFLLGNSSSSSEA